MKMKPLTYLIPFEKLIGFFTRTSGKVLNLNPKLGTGFVQIYNLEKGLQARIWDCTFRKEIELNNAENENEDKYYNIAFFLEINGISFCRGQGPYQDGKFWDNLFLSSDSDFKMHIDPEKQVRCLSVSFSEKWLCHTLEENKTLKEVKEILCTSKMLSFSSTMTVSDKNLLHELITNSWEKYFGTFYIKSVVLKLITNFFYRLFELDEHLMIQLSADNVVYEVEQYLNNHIQGKLPALKALASNFSMSESTLKRQFLKRHGSNISTYFMNKKMEYVQHLIKEKNIELTEAAHLVGYQSLSNFMKMYNKYHGVYIPCSTRISKRA
jgi:AraC-like DNA-binding protein